MTTRLSEILPGIISSQRCGFVSARLITENVGLVQEIVQYIDQ